MLASSVVSQQSVPSNRCVLHLNFWFHSCCMNDILSYEQGITIAWSLYSSSCSFFFQYTLFNVVTISNVSSTYKKYILNHFLIVPSTFLFVLLCDIEWINQKKKTTKIRDFEFLYASMVLFFKIIIFQINNMRALLGIKQEVKS